MPRSWTMWGIRSALCAAVALGAAAPADAAPPSVYYKYRTVEQLIEATRNLAGGSDRAAVEAYGESREGRDLLVLTLSDDPSTAGERPALLLVAGMDGRHRAGPEVALRVAQDLLDRDGDPLDGATVYVLPLANPDAMARNEALDIGSNVTARPVDADRDGRVDEDPPNDLDGDGVITMMRVEDPPMHMAATHVPDPAEPRLLVEADAAKGQRPRYAVLVEGRDDDGDGRIAEDGPGGVDPDRNFLHEWPEHALNAGPYQLSEPETLGIARFVLEHPNIVAAVVYGRHDNVVKPPSGKGSDVSGRGPKYIHEDDVPLYAEVSKLYRELTGQKRAGESDPDGSLHAWLYAQRGVPTFATTIWGRPDPTKQEDGDDDERGGDDAGERDGANEAAAATTQPEGDRDATPRRDADEKPADPEAAAWLAYADERGVGFREWTAVEHPTLGPVEVGGFLPGFMLTPPADELDELAAKQAYFAAALLERRPRITVRDPEVRRLGPGLYEVRLAIVNEGYLPTATAMARRGRSVMPTVVRLSVPVERIVAGDRVSRHWGIDGSGRRVVEHWIVRVDDGAAIEVEVHDAQIGDTTVRFRAEETER